MGEVKFKMLNVNFAISVYRLIVGYSTKLWNKREHINIHIDNMNYLTGFTPLEIKGKKYVLYLCNSE
jgi:hypothetical protein